MGTFEEKSKVQFLIDTKGLCLLCFGDTEQNDIFATFSVEGSKHLQLLSRYLNINLGKVLNLQDTLKSEETIPLNNSELLVTLCPKCKIVMKQFSHYYKELHMMQMNLNVTVRKIHDMTISAEKDYLIRMTAMAKNPLELIQANIVENLRKDIIRKCSTHRKQELPRVSLSRLNRKRALVAESRLPVKKKRSAGVTIFEPRPNPIASDKTGKDLPKATRKGRMRYSFITKLDGTTYRDSSGHLRSKYWCQICKIKINRNLGKHVKQKHPAHHDPQGAKTGPLNKKQPAHHEAQGTGAKNGPFIVKQSFRDKSGFLRYKYYCKLCQKKVSGLNSHKKFHQQQELSNINYEESPERIQLNLPVPTINGNIKANEKEVPYFFPVTSSRYRDAAGRIKYRRFYCKICDKTVSSNIHKTVHSGKAYSCNYCPASFKTSVTRNFHIVITHCEHYFPSLRQPGISKTLFKRAVDQLFVEKVAQGIDGSQHICCHFCDETAHRGRMKIKIRQHMIKFHFHALTSKLLALQKNPSAITLPAKKKLSLSRINSTELEPDVPQSCLSCNKVLPSRAEWLKHTRLYCPSMPAPKPVGIASMSHPPSDRVCRHCNETFRTSTQRTAHQIDVHPATFFTSLQSSVITNQHFKAALETLFESIKIFSLIYESGEEIDYAGCPHCKAKFRSDTEEDKVQYARAHMINNHRQILENKLAQLLEVEEKIGIASLLYTSQSSETVTLPWDTVVTTTASFEGNEDNLVPSGTSGYTCRFCKTDFSYKRSLIFHELSAHSEQSFLFLKPPDLYMEQFKAWIEELFVDLKDVPVVDEEGKMRTAICCPFCEQMSKPKINRVLYIRHHMIQEHYDILKTNLNEILVKNGFSIVENAENGEFASAPVSDLGHLEELYENEDIDEDDSFDLDLSDSPQVEAILETKIEEEDAEWEQSEPIDNSMLPLDIGNEEGETEEPPVSTAEMDFIDENEEAMETEEVDPLFILP